MKIIELFIGTNGIHICIDTVVWLYLILSQSKSLPFGKRMHHLRSLFAKVLDREGDGTLNTVQVIVDSESLKHEERRCHTTETKLRTEVLLKEIFYLLDALLRMLHVEQSFIAFRLYQFAHYIWFVV